MQDLQREIVAALTRLWQEHRGQTIGLGIGLFVGVCILLFGFWHILFIACCGALGRYIGGRVPAGETVLADWVEYLHQRWQHFRRGY